MKKILILLTILLLPVLIMATDCPQGEVNCEYPGDCGAYTDQNNDNLCDNSQETQKLEYSSEKIDLTNGTKIIVLPYSDENETKIQNLTERELLDFKVINFASYYDVDKEALIKKLSKELDIKVSEKHTLRILKENYNLTLDRIKEISDKIKTPKKIKYLPLEILIITSILYFISWFLTKKKKISKINHRKFWNIMLLISFFICSVLGFLTTTQIALGWPKWNIRGLHVDPGIAFSVIGVFHTFWHIPYLKRILKFK